MKFFLLPLSLIFTSIISYSDDSALSSRSSCYFIVDPLVYGNPVEGGMEDVTFSDDKDPSNTVGCFNILKWMVLPEDETFIGEFGKFYYRNPKTNYSRECRYEVVDLPATLIKENLSDILMKTNSIDELIPHFNEYQSELDKSVVVRCDFVSM